ncbi:MAG TPA: hypothetical protein V6D19_05440 [Stenomitos sp.]
MLKTSPNRQCEYVQFSLPIFWIRDVIVSEEIKEMKLHCTENLKERLIEFKQLANLSEQQTKSFDELSEKIIRDYKIQNEMMVEQSVKFTKFLDILKYFVKKHNGNDRKLKALRDDVKRVVNETFGDY